MKHPFANTAWLAALAAALLAGCSEKPPETSGTDAPVQGELIATPAPAEKPAQMTAPPERPAEPAPKVEPSTVAATAPAAADVSAAPAAGAKEGEYLTVGFDKLAGFEYEMPDETNVSATNAPPGEPVAREQIPADIKALNAKRVALKGFMLPLKVEGGLITELLVMRDQSMCCFGTVPKINEWVSVKMVGKGVKPIMDQAVTIYGALKVGEMYESGYLVGIYALDGERMSGPLDL
jgi:hypothetical protein